MVSPRFGLLLAALVLLLWGTGPHVAVRAQSTTVFRGGQLFDVSEWAVRPNPGLVVRAGKIVARGATACRRDTNSSAAFSAIARNSSTPVAAALTFPSDTFLISTSGWSASYVEGGVGVEVAMNEGPLLVFGHGHGGCWRDGRVTARYAGPACVLSELPFSGRRPHIVGSRSHASEAS